MKVEIVAFKREHLADLGGQESAVPAEALDSMEKDPWTATGLLNGLPLFCGGIVQHKPWIGEAWAIVSPRCRGEPAIVRQLVKVFRAVLRHCPLRRVEASVRADFDAGHRLALAMGFRMEAQHRLAYGPNGEDYALYARVVA